MQNLMVDFIISLDGYAAAEGWPGFWGLEGPEYSFVLTVQWHPEEMVRKHEWARRLFAALVSAAAERKATRAESEAAVGALRGFAA